MKKPQVANLKGQSFQVGKLVKQRASLLIDDTDFVRRTTVGREETRDLRHCSRSGAYTYSESKIELTFSKNLRSPRIAYIWLGSSIPQALDVRGPMDKYQL